MKGVAFMKRYSYEDQMKEILALINSDIEKLETLPKADAKKFAKQELIKTGIIDESGKFTKPYIALGKANV